MDNTIFLTSGQKIEVLFQDEVSLDIDCALRYIKSGEQELDNYIENNLKKRLDETITNAKSDMNKQISQGIEDASISASTSAKQAIDESVSSIKDDLLLYSTNELKPELEALVDVASQSAEIASNKSAQTEVYQANAASYATQANQAAADVLINKQEVENLINQAVSGYIGDIGYAPLGINESLNQRRYLNGQIISQEQFVEFTQILKERASLYPSLLVNENEWQAEVANSKLGQCGKFVIDDDKKTIRLPKVININGLSDLTSIGSIKNESLPNITGEFTLREKIGFVADTPMSGVFKLGEQVYSNKASSTASTAYSAIFDASLSSNVYQNQAPVQQESVQYPFFIQVALGVQEVVDITRQIELNNPFFLGMSQYFVCEPNNVSWLLSNNQFYSGAIYVSFYEWLLKIYNGNKVIDGISVKAKNEEYNDYDYVIDISNTTFRLPIKIEYENNTSAKLYFYVGETCQDSNLINIGAVLAQLANKVDINEADYVIDSYIDNEGNWYRFYKSGWLEQGGITVSSSSNTITLLKPFIDKNYIAFAQVIGENTNNLGTKITKNNQNQITIYNASTSSCMWQAQGKGA